MKLKVSYEIDVNPEYDDTDFSQVMSGGRAWQRAYIGEIAVYIPLDAELEFIQEPFPDLTVVRTIRESYNLLYVKLSGSWLVASEYDNAKFTESAYEDEVENHLCELISKGEAKVLS